MSVDPCRPVRVLVCVSLLACALAFFGCASEPEEVVEPEEMAPEDFLEEPEMAMDDAPTIFFMAPEDGADVTSPVHVMMGAENFTIEPRVEGEINPNAGHHHLGIDTECLGAGIVIPEAEPWIHFGDGSNMIDVQLTPGEHTLVAQAGDGEHRTLDEPGLCAVITVNVVESEEMPEEE